MNNNIIIKKYITIVLLFTSNRNRWKKETFRRSKYDIDQYYRSDI